MSAFPALDPLRIGCVKYLNSKPLIQAYTGEVTFDHPSQLARDLRAGRLDAALVPIFESFGPSSYLAVDHVAIASDGPVFSVYLAYTGDLQRVRTIALDPASLTSAHLVQVLLREFHGVQPRCVTQGEEADAELLIGNQALDYRRDAPSEVQFLDLGEEWKARTDLPFVFAVWLLRAELEGAEAVAEDFRRLKKYGLSLIPEICAQEREVPQELATRYLTQHIRFDLGEAEKEAIELFRQLSHRHGFLRETGSPLCFV